MNLTDVVFLPLPEGVQFEATRESEKAKATAVRLGMIPQMDRDLNRPGLNIAAAMGRDGEWMRAIIASNDPEVTGFDWMGFSVSPISEEATNWLLELVVIVSRADPSTARLVEH